MKTKGQRLDKNEQISFIYWLLLLIMISFLFIAPFHTALFNGYSPQYEAPIFGSILASSIVLVLLAIYFFFNWKFEDYRDLLAVYIWLVPITFYISTIAAASPHLAKGMTYIHIMYTILFIFGAYMARNVWGARILQLAVTIAGYVVVLYGIACAFGNMYAQDAVMLTEQGYRLTSVFQYANAYAAYLMAILLCCLYYITHSKKWYLVILHTMMLVPILVSFWLTLSRGAIVTLPFIFLAILPLLSLTRQIAISLYTLVGTLASFVITGPVEDKSTKIIKKVLETVSPDAKSAITLNWFHADSLSGWGIVLIASVLAAAVIFVLQFYVFQKLEQRLKSFSERKLSRVVLPGGLVVLGVLVGILLFGTSLKGLLPKTLQTRLENINFQQNSVLERGTFYKDSIKVWLESPVIGTGGGGWAALYEKFQNNPYVSRQAHNFFLQYLVEVGIIGFVVFVLLLVTVFGLFIRKSFINKDSTNSHLVFYLTALSILIHSILDFEMSYVYLGALVFLCLGGITSVLDIKPKWLPGKWTQSSKRTIYPAVISVAAIIFFIVSFRNVSADNSYKKAIDYARQGKSFNEVMNTADNAIKTASNHPDYLILKSELLLQAFNQTKKEEFWTGAKNVLEQAKQAEPNNRAILEHRYQLFMQKQLYEQAITVLQEGIEKYPWELSYYERAATLYSSLWNSSRQQNNQESQAIYSKLLQDNYSKVEVGVQHLATLPKEQLQGRPFSLTSLIRYSVGQMYAVEGQKDKALATLQPAAAEALEKLKGQLQPAEIEQYKTIIRWYLAVSKKSGKLDQGAYDSFVGNNQQEQQQIEALASSLQ